MKIIFQMQKKKENYKINFYINYFKLWDNWRQLQCHIDFAGCVPS